MPAPMGLPMAENLPEEAVTVSAGLFKKTGDGEAEEEAFPGTPIFGDGRQSETVDRGGRRGRSCSQRMACGGSARPVGISL